MAADWQAGAASAQTHPSLIMDEGWCGLNWTPWAPLEREAIRQTAPALPGVYRIRHASGTPQRFIYVGQTGRTLRERLSALASGANAGACPFDDPHTAAPHLWLLRQLDDARFECSCAPVEGDVQLLRGTEDMLLWRHRVETGLSVEANYGRFYPGYARSTNRWIVRGGALGARTPGRRAEPFADQTRGTDFSGSRPALTGAGWPLEAPWWHRSPLTASRSLSPGPAVYVIHERNAAEPAYIGETSSLPGRAAVHSASLWPLVEPTIAYLPLPAGTPKHVLRELESDLLGWHFSLKGRAPALQYAERARKAAVGAALAAAQPSHQA
jgi:hypothetical protein